MFKRSYHIYVCTLYTGFYSRRNDHCKGTNIQYTGKPVLRGHLWDKEKVAL